MTTPRSVHSMGWAIYMVGNIVAKMGGEGEICGGARHLISGAEALSLVS